MGRGLGYIILGPREWQVHRWGSTGVWGPPPQLRVTALASTREEPSPNHSPSPTPASQALTCWYSFFSRCSFCCWICSSTSDFSFCWISSFNWVIWWFMIRNFRRISLISLCSSSSCLLWGQCGSYEALGRGFGPTVQAQRGFLGHCIVFEQVRSPLRAQLLLAPGSTQYGCVCRAHLHKTRPRPMHGRLVREPKECIPAL